MQLESKRMCATDSNTKGTHKKVLISNTSVLWDTEHNFRFVFENMKRLRIISTGIRANLIFLVKHNIFLQGIRVCIFLNTLSMSIEHHDQPETLTRIVEISNLTFSCIFSIEMMLKLTAHGVVEYVSNGFNVFDGLVVFLGYLLLRLF